MREIKDVYFHCSLIISMTELMEFGLRKSKLVMSKAVFIH